MKFGFLDHPSRYRRHHRSVVAYFASCGTDTVVFPGYTKPRSCTISLYEHGRVKTISVAMRAHS